MIAYRDLEMDIKANKSIWRSIILTNPLNEDLLKDAFDKEFLNRLKEETKSQKQVNEAPYDGNNNQKLFSNTMFTSTKFSNVKTNPTTPDVHTPVRSPQTNKESKGENKRSTFYNKVKKDNGN